MIVASGIIPYEYSAQTPFRATDYLDPVAPLAIGPSGLLLEQAYFVLMAEYRRYRGLDSFFEPNFYKYINQEISKVGIEPRPNGENLASGLAAGLIYTNHISDGRTALEAVFPFIEIDSDYTEEEIKQDWLIKTYNTPSGRVGDYYHSDAHSTGRVPTEEHFLGGSGVLFDVDLGEIMYNPYPRFGASSLDSAKVSISTGSFSVPTFPFFPTFQKTDGSLISVTSRETDYRDGFISTGYNLISLNASGVIRFDGDVLRQETVYFVGTGNGFNDSGASDFTFVDGSTRRVGVFADIAEPQTRVFVTPTTQTSGVYQIIASNPRSTVPATAIPSGEISIWPPLDQAFPNYNASSFDGNDGYEVFDDCFWMVDIPGPGALASGDEYAPSGLAVISPFTGRALWVRWAQPTVTSHASSAEQVAWPDLCGLARTGANRIYRVATNLDTNDAIFMRYNDNLDFVSETAATISTPAGVNELFDMFHDGTDFFVLEQNNGNTVQIDGITFTEIARYIGISNERKGEYFNSKYWQWRSGVSGINEVTYSAGSPGSVNNVAFKEIRMPPALIGTNGSVAISANIEDVIEVTGSTHIPNGIWALVEYTIGASIRPYLVKVTESATTFEVDAVIPLIVSNYHRRSFRGQGNRFYDLLYMDVN